MKQARQFKLQALYALWVFVNPKAWAIWKGRGK